MSNILEYTGFNKSPYCYNKLKNTYASKCPPVNNNTWNKIEAGLNCMQRSTFDQARIEGKQWPKTNYIPGWKYS